MGSNYLSIVIITYDVVSSRRFGVQGIVKIFLIWMKSTYYLLFSKDMGEVKYDFGVHKK